MTDRPLLLTELVAADCCMAERRLFEQMFGEGGVVTHARTMEGAQLFDWFDGARRLLTPAQLKVFRTTVTVGFRMAARVPDKQQILRRNMLAEAFYTAYSSPKE